MDITPTFNITRIYLVTNCYGDPNKVYIGKTISSRLYEHKKTFGGEINYDYIDEVNSLRKKDWIPLEKFWIEYFRFLGFDVQNKNSGGGGVEFCSDKHRLGISLGNKGKIKSIEHKNILSERLKKTILQYDLEGNFIQEWESVKLAFNNTKINGISPNLRMKQKSAGGFIWKYKNEPISNFSKLVHKSCKKVIQYDLNYNIIKIWPSIKEASQILNIQETGITGCCKGKKITTGGYIWRYENSPLDINYIIPIHKSSIPVIQYNKVGGFIKEWSSAKDASKNLNIHSPSITQCCKGDLKTSGNFIWKYKH